MIKHIVMWKMKEELSTQKKQEITVAFQQAMIQLSEELDGVKHVEVIYDLMDSSNMDLLLIGEYQDEAALIAYQMHPMHIEAAKPIKENAILRSCVDFK